MAVHADEGENGGEEDGHAGEVAEVFEEFGPIVIDDEADDLEGGGGELAAFGFDEFVELGEEVEDDAEGEDDDDGDEVADEKFFGDVAVEEFRCKTEVESQRFFGGWAIFVSVPVIVS